MCKLPRVPSAALLATVLSGCVTAVSYRDPAGPRYCGGLPSDPPEAQWHDTLRIVSFNVEHAARIGDAIAALKSVPETARPDLLLLQEMNAEGADSIAEAMGMGWVYYPAVRYKTDTEERDFGNAVLSRWPIEDDKKLLLPNVAVFGRTRRIATVVTIRVGATPVRVYSVHLGTPINMSLRDRAAQMRAVLDDAARHPHVIVGGDLNSHGLAELGARRGYAWPTEDGPNTVTFGRWDHILLKGLEPSGRPGDTGTVEDNHDASDHLPVWTTAVLR